MNSSSLSRQKSCFLKLKQPDGISLNPGKRLSELHSFQGLDSMWALSWASGRGRWVWAVWTLTFEPRGHMSLGAIFWGPKLLRAAGRSPSQATVRVQNCHKSVAWRSENWTAQRCVPDFTGSILVWHGPDVPTHPPSALFFSEATSPNETAAVQLSSQWSVKHWMYLFLQPGSQDWNISTSTACIHGRQMMNPNNAGDSLTFPPAPPWGWRHTFMIF